MKNLNLLLIFSFTIKILVVEGIIGGMYAEHNQFKYFALVTKNQLPACGGAIISSRHVLSAAHCIINPETNKFKDAKFTVQTRIVSLAERNTQKIERTIVKFYVPKACEFVSFEIAIVSGYCEIGDIAVLLLDAPLPLEPNSNINLINLPENVENRYVNEIATITGFGAESLDECISTLDAFILRVFKFMRVKLKYAKSKVISYEECSLMYSGTIDADNHLCAQLIQHDDNISEGCAVGDSGGPLVLDNTVIGILVNGAGDCDEKVTAAVYTRVTHFLPFIRNAMADVVTSDMRVALYERKRVLLMMKDVLTELKISK